MKNKLQVLLFLTIAQLFLQACYSKKSQLGGLPQLGKDNVADVVAAMTPEEKVSMSLGNSDWSNTPIQPNPGFAGYTHLIPRLGINTTIGMQGSGAGVLVSEYLDASAEIKLDTNVNVVIAKSGDSKKKLGPFYCTAFPNTTSLAATWNDELIEKVGKGMGNESLEYNSDILLGPGQNIQRNPLCGRNFEYCSEDPLLSGKTAAALVRGVQSMGVGTSIKHFLANNQETNRKTQNSVISQRALREIYLRGFEITVKESKPWTVMVSYNRLNGRYTCENPDLLDSILRKEWGFEGVVLTDWTCGADAVAKVSAGSDLLMPGESIEQNQLLAGLKNKKLDGKVLDKNLARVLTLIQKTPRFKQYKPSYQPNLKENAATAHEAATEAIVLLKNSNALPFGGVKKVALFGKTSYDFIVGGAGSALVNNEYVVSLDEALTKRYYLVNKPLADWYTNQLTKVRAEESKKLTWWKWQKYMISYCPELVLPRSIISEQVSSSDLAIITIGRNSGEGWDRREDDFFNLSETEQALIRNVSEAYHAAGKKVVVILNVPGVIEMASWRNYPDAILMAWQLGQEAGNALVDVLKGDVNPSGKLPTTVPVKYADVPSSKTFPNKVIITDNGYLANGIPEDTVPTLYTDGKYEGYAFLGHRKVHISTLPQLYNEGIYVGYRYYDTFRVPDAYEFGFGLSYTSFEYSDLKLSSPSFSGKMTVNVTVKNSGKLPGKEVVQLYLSAPNTEIEKPIQELKGYAKTKLLQPGESQLISFELDARLLASFWSGISAWVADKGSYEVRIGASSRDIRLKGSFSLPEEIIVEKAHNVLYPDFPLDELNQTKK
ncbi:MAG: glycoside hydrolase family 3 C-terminal domain-containing protein [Bacteroidota bacterium]|nr:glycoside hydrolase family 3 C-terminal domain-containing protein [Bacteroidota bacterium]